MTAGGPASRRGAGRWRGALAWILALAPALAWVAWVVLRYGPERLGFGRALALGLFTGLGVLGLTALLVAYLPFTLERLGLLRLARLLRSVWDEDAR